MEFIEPGQLSITLYSVCKILNLNTESPVWMLSSFFLLFSFSYYFSVRHALPRHVTRGFYEIT